MADAERYQHYEVLRREDGSLWELGRGAMGITYKAFDTNLRCPVALKVINNSSLNSEVARQRFLREARAAASLRHQNVASVFHLGTDHESYFYAMEYIDGETVDAHIKRKGLLDLAEALGIVLQVSRALSAADKEKLVHRDLKPSNLMLVREDDEMVVKVIDFGLAKSTERRGESSGALTVGGVFVGTPHFASPEQLEEREIDIRSDIYSLGATLYYMLAGHPPYSGSIAQIMSKHLYKPVPLEPLEGLPTCVVELIRRMMEKDPAKRPQRPADLRREILPCLRRVQTSAIGSSPVAGMPIEGEQPDTLATLDLSTIRTGADESATIIAQRYKIISYLGDLPQGRRFLADDRRRGRQVSLLLLSHDFVSDSKSYMALEQEIDRLRRWPNPLLRQVYSLESAPQLSFLVEELVFGPSLLELLRARGLLSPSETWLVLNLLAPVADHAQSNDLQQVNFTLSGVQLVSTSLTESWTESDILRQPLTRWEQVGVKVGAVDFSSLSASEPATWVGAATLMQTAQRGGPRASYLRMLSLLVYELLGGPRSSVELTGRYSPVASLSERGNALLRRGLVDEFRSATEMALQLGGEIVSRNADPVTTTAMSRGSPGASSGNLPPQGVVSSSQTTAPSNFASQHVSQPLSTGDKTRRSRTILFSVLILAAGLGTGVFCLYQFFLTTRDAKKGHLPISLAQAGKPKAQASAFATLEAIGSHSAAAGAPSNRKAVAIPSAAAFATPAREASPGLEASATSTRAALASPSPEASAMPTQEALASPGPEASAMPTREALASPSPEASAMPTQEALASPGPEANAMPTREALASPSPEASAMPTQEALASPGPEASAMPTREALASPNSVASAMPNQEALANPGPGASGTPTRETLTSPNPESSAMPNREVLASPGPGASGTPTRETLTSPNPESSAMPNREVLASPGPGASGTPTRETLTSPNSESSAMPNREVLANPGPEASATPAREALANPSPEASARPTREALANPSPESIATPTREALASPSPETSATPAREALASPSPGASGTPTREPLVSPSPGASGTLAREPLVSPSPETPSMAKRDAATAPGSELLGPASPAVKASFAADNYSEKLAAAQRLIESNDWEGALKTYLDLIDRYPEKPTATQSLGNLLTDLSAHSSRLNSESFTQIKPDLVRAANIGVVPAMLMVARSSRETDRADALKWYEAAASKGSVEGMKRAGDLLYSNHKRPEDDQKALDYFTQAANAGDPEAEYLAGECYYFGKGAAPDIDKAVQFLQHAAARRDPRAMDLLGTCYRKQGKFAEARRSFEEAATAGYALSYFNVGVMYMNGEGVPRSPRKAQDQFRRSAELFKQSAEKGDGVDMFYYANWLEQGIGVPKDEKGASEWYRRSARAGYSQAIDWCKRNGVAP